MYWIYAYYKIIQTLVLFLKPKISTFIISIVLYFLRYSIEK